MKQFHISQLFSLTLSFALLLAPLPLSAIAKAEFILSSVEGTDRSAMAENLVDTLSAIEKQSLKDNHYDRYMHLGKEFSNIHQIISSIKDLDCNEESILAELHKHIEDGFFIG